MQEANVRVHFTEKATGDTGTIDMFFASASVRLDNLSPDTAWIEYDEFWEWANQSPHLQYGNCEWIGGETEGDLERRQAEEEAVKPKRTVQDWYNDRMREAAEQAAEAEDPYGEHWQKLVRGHSKTDLIKALENALRRAEKSRQGEQAADAEIERLRAENAALLESCKNLRRAAMFAYNLTSGQGAWYDESNEVEGESNAGVFLTIVRAEEEKLGILL